MSVRPAKTYKIVSFAMILFSCGALTATLLLSLIEMIVNHFGGKLSPMAATLPNIFMIVTFIIFFLTVAILITRDAIRRVLIVREIDD